MFKFFGATKEDPIGEELVEFVRCYLGTEGIDVFTEIYKNYGTLNAVEPRPHGIPHAIHFKEGMEMRNMMRIFHSGRGIANWSPHEYDSRWEETVLRACNIKWTCPEIDKRR